MLQRVGTMATRRFRMIDRGPFRSQCSTHFVEHLPHPLRKVQAGVHPGYLISHMLVRDHSMLTPSIKRTTSWALSLHSSWILALTWRLKVILMH